MMRSTTSRVVDLGLFGGAWARVPRVVKVKAGLAYRLEPEPCCVSSPGIL